MLTQIHNRSTTKDVDVIVKDLDPVTSEEYRIFKQAVTFVAQDKGVNPAWLSDNIAQFLLSIGTVPAGTLWFSQGKLEVYIPEGEYVLLTKLLSGRGKDTPDIEALLAVLGITNRAQAEGIIQNYLDSTTQQQYAQDLETVLNLFFD